MVYEGNSQLLRRADVRGSAETGAQKMKDMKMTDQVTGQEIGRHEKYHSS